ncbi:MAG: hypothetical protein PHT12_04715 [Patescibacteria group bacterium]|nr:hypothetical protein [Patescibacteria group bacterium]
MTKQQRRVCWIIYFVVLIAFVLIALCVKKSADNRLKAAALAAIGQTEHAESLARDKNAYSEIGYGLPCGSGDESVDVSISGVGTLTVCCPCRGRAWNPQVTGACTVYRSTTIYLIQPPVKK